MVYKVLRPYGRMYDGDHSMIVIDWKSEYYVDELECKCIVDIDDHIGTFIADYCGAKIKLGLFTAEEYNVLIGHIAKNKLISHIEFIEQPRTSAVLDAIANVESIRCLTKICWKQNDNDILIAKLHKLKYIEEINFGIFAEFNGDQVWELSRNIGNVKSLKLTVRCEGDPVTQCLFGIGLTKLSLHLTGECGHNWALFEAIGRDETIVDLNLRVTFMNEIEIDMFANAIKENKTLQHLTFNIDSGEFNESIVNAIANSQNIKHFRTFRDDFEIMLTLLRDSSLHVIEFPYVSEGTIAMYDVDDILANNYRLINCSSVICGKWISRNLNLRWQYMRSSLVEFVISFGSTIDQIGLDTALIVKLFDAWYEEGSEKFHSWKKVKLVEGLRASIKKAKNEFV